MSTLEEQFTALLNHVTQLSPDRAYALRREISYQRVLLDEQRRALPAGAERSRLDELSARIDNELTNRLHRHRNPLVIDPQPPRETIRERYRER